jgi:hypothetical protein
MPGGLPGEEGRGLELMTIGEFARASRLSAKALRLYDELGLLRPALVDPLSQYRFYDPAQVEHGPTARCATCRPRTHRWLVWAQR